MNKKKTAVKSVETITHDAKRRNIPTAEFEPLMRKDEKTPIQIAIQRRNRDLDPQLVWRGKDEQDWSDLIVHAPPLYIQEKVHPKVLIDDLKKQTEEQGKKEAESDQIDLFSDFNGLPSQEAKTEFYQHEANWSNRMILGDSLQVMASLAEREGLRGQVQCIYFDPPYGIKFNSNFQWSTKNRDVKDGNKDHITREPEQVKAFRDTWRDGIHSYLTYLRDRLTVARDLLTESGSIFVQIGDENVHLIRILLDEIFGVTNFISMINYKTTSGQTAKFLSTQNDYILFYAKNANELKYRQLFEVKNEIKQIEAEYNQIDDFGRRYQSGDLTSQTGGASTRFAVNLHGIISVPSGSRGWRTNEEGMASLIKADRLFNAGKMIRYKRFYDDNPLINIQNVWSDTGIGFGQEKIYVVQTNEKVISRCILMTTDPGDLVLDPTCGSGATAYVAEQWGRRWITIDTSRVALALARSRIMGARYPYYILADSIEGQLKEAELTKKAPSTAPTYGNIRHGFVYERVPHITLKSIANNAEIDVIWEKFQQKMEPVREKLNKALKQSWQEWEIPREIDEKWTSEAKKLHEEWWELRIARQKEIDASIAAKADYEYLYDKPYEDKKKIRVAGPFTVESLSPHRILAVDENDEIIDEVRNPRSPYGQKQDFASMILENLRTAGVQQAHKEDKINFTSLTPWPGDLICAEGRYMEGDKEIGIERRAGIFIGPEFGTVAREDLVKAARECGDADFDVLIACAFSYEAHTTEFEKLGRIRVLKARMNADLHMAEDLKNTGKGNLFVIFGEPDIDVASEEWLVDSFKKKVAPYEIFKNISGTNSLAEINKLDSKSLQTYAILSCRREIWDYLTDEASRIINSCKHSRGAGQEYKGGVSSVSWYCAGLSSGVGNICDTLRKAGVFESEGFRNLVSRLGRNKQNASWPDQITFNSPLKTNNYVQVKINGVDVFHPNTGEIISDNADGIACWFVDTDYNEESFFVRQAYFLGANDPYKSLKTTLKAEINQEAWDTLHSDTSRPFDKPKSGRIAVKVINHLGDEVMKVYKVD